MRVWRRVKLERSEGIVVVVGVVAVLKIGRRREYFAAAISQLEHPSKPPQNPWFSGSYFLRL